MMKKWSDISLNGLQLKLLGWFFTLFHLASLLFFPEGGSAVATVLSFIGYMALPIFAFLLVEGFAYTEKRIRYVLLLLGAAVTPGHFSLLSALLLGLASLAASVLGGVLGVPGEKSGKAKRKALMKRMGQ